MLIKLTDSHARNAKARGKSYKLADGNGLHLFVTPQGGRFWRYRYRINGIENLFAIGSYPTLSLQQARQARDEARTLVAQGIHPAHERKASRLVVAESARATFVAVANEWIERNRAHWSAYYCKQVKTVMARDVFPSIGAMPVTAVKSAHLLAILKKVEGRGANSVALLIRQWCSAIFRYAISTLRADGDPAVALKGAISKPRTKHKRALDPAALRTMLTKIDTCSGDPRVGIALRLLLLTFVRPGELRQARWSEFDLENSEWRIPAARMKMREPHVVPLSRQALEALNHLAANSVPRRELVFPNVRDPFRAMSATTLNRRLERMGYRNSFSAHGFRSTASTLLNEFGYRPDVIERQLAHKERNSVRASYNHATYLADRRRMMQAWADYLEGLDVREGGAAGR